MFLSNSRLISISYATRYIHLLVISSFVTYVTHLYNIHMSYLSSNAVPPSPVVIHLTCAARGSAEKDLSPAVARLQQLVAASRSEEEADPGTPLKVLSALYFSRRAGGSGGRGGDLPDSVAFCSGPDDAIGFDAVVQEVSVM